MHNEKQKTGHNHKFGFTIDFNGKLYALFVLSSFIFFYGGLPFLKGFKEVII